MVARKLLTATTVGLSLSLLAQHAAGSEPNIAQKQPVVEELVVEAELFRNDLDAYVRELDRQIRSTLSEELRRGLAPKVVLASNELRTST